MKRKSVNSWIIVAGLAVVAQVTSSARASILVNEQFSHPDGNLFGQTPSPGPGGTWALFSGDGSNPINVSSGAAVMGLGSGSWDDLETGFGTFTTGLLYYGFDFWTTDPGVPFGADNEYFAHFKTAGNNFTTGFTARMDIVGPSSGGDYSVGIADGQTAEATWPFDLNFGTHYRAVVEFDFGSGISTLWINPTQYGDTSIQSTVPSSISDLQAFGFRQSHSQEANVFKTVDNLIVATTFAEAVPEPASALLLGMGGFALVARRGRRVVA